MTDKIVNETKPIGLTDEEKRQYHHNHITAATIMIIIITTITNMITNTS
jgi:hypothetical protein